MVKRITNKIKLKKLEKEHSKTDVIAISNMEELLRTELNYALNMIDTMKLSIEKQLDRIGNLEEKDRFFYNKIAEALDKLDNYRSKLIKLQRTKELRPREIYEIIDKTNKTHKLILTLKEFIFRLKSESSDNTE